MNAPRSNTDAPYVYTGTHLDDQDQAATIRRAESEAKGKTPRELFSMAVAEHYMATRHYPRTCGRQWQADRALLRAVTFDRLARELDDSFPGLTGPAPVAVEVATGAACIECGTEVEEGSTVCSSLCGNTLVGDYPDSEKDYSDCNYDYDEDPR